MSTICVVTPVPSGVCVCSRKLEEKLPELARFLTSERLDLNHAALRPQNNTNGSLLFCRRVKGSLRGAIAANLDMKHLRT
jgi:hypothetical protein